MTIAVPKTRFPRRHACRIRIRFMSLYDRLTAYCGSDAYPFHMPGHKRRAGFMQDPYSFDITEIDGFDNLHHATGVLAAAQQAAADLYHSSETHFLVNGSTAGVLAAITASVPPGGLLLMARNSHRSAWNAAGLLDITAEYLYPVPKGDINGPVRPEDLEDVLRRFSEAPVPDHGKEKKLPSAVFLTSPTYDGVISDVRAIAETAHRYGVILIVDEAHGAHFGMHPAFPPSSVTLGADIVIHSLHKTLPALTQTALLHVNGDLVDRRKLRRMLSVFQTSSPSYVLMASIDSCIRLLSENGDMLFHEYVRRLTHFREHAVFPQIRLLKTDDPSRILLQPENMTAARLYELLRDRFHLQPEMLSPSYVLLLSSVPDDEEGFTRLLQALTELNDMPGSLQPVDNADLLRQAVLFQDRPRVRCSVFRALHAEQKTAVFREASGLVSAEYLYLYPPGVPLLVPGEEITPSVIRRTDALLQAGYELQGTDDFTLRTIRTVSCPADSFR